MDRAEGRQAIVAGRVAKGGSSPLLAVSVEALAAGGKVVARHGASLVAPALPALGCDARMFEDCTKWY